MDAATLFAVAQFRQVTMAQLLYGGDKFNANIRQAATSLRLLQPYWLDAEAGRLHHLRDKLAEAFECLEVGALTAWCVFNRTPPATLPFALL